MNPNARLIEPHGLPLAILIITSIFLGLSVLTVSLRTCTRLTKGIFGLDDTFIVIGTVSIIHLLSFGIKKLTVETDECRMQVVYTVASSLAIYGVLIGLGQLQVDLNQWQSEESMKYYILWILTYVLALATVKSSVCMTILRIGSTKMNLRITIYALLAITWASFLITFIGTLTYCHPVRAIWLPRLVISGHGTCASVDTFVIIGHTATVSTIITDLALVVVPGFILWNTQMKRQAKIQAFALLSFASMYVFREVGSNVNFRKDSSSCNNSASIITMIRIPYVNKFEGMTDLQCQY